jgi:uncharacterized damage-inducible protein DinB
LQRRTLAIEANMTLNPYAYALEARDPVAVIAQTPAQLAQKLAALTPQAINHPPAPGKWSPREVLAHLADCEIAFGFRLRQAHAGEGQIQPFDQDKWARAYAQYTAEQALRAFTTLRDWNVAFIRGISDADKHLPTHHPERGAGTLWTIVETMGGHDLHHLALLDAQIA